MTARIVRFSGDTGGFAVVQAIRELKREACASRCCRGADGYPAGNGLPNPYSAMPRRPASQVSLARAHHLFPGGGFAGTMDKTGAAATQVTAFFGGHRGGLRCRRRDRQLGGPSGDWGLRRMVLHYAHLCAAAGGVNAFLLSSGQRGLTTIRSGASTYPAVTALRSLAADVPTILGVGTQISYAADWTEYFGHQPQDGSGTSSSISTRSGR